MDRDTIHAAKARARQEGTSLDALLRAYVTRYAHGEAVTASEVARRAGQARWAGRSDDDKAAHGRAMAAARWAAVASRAGRGPLGRP